MAYSIIKTRLKKGAFKWLITKSDTVTTFDTFIVAFSSTFTWKWNGESKDPGK